MAIVAGTNSADLISTFLITPGVSVGFTTDDADQIRGRSGNDTIIAGGGSDSIWGGNGNDSLQGNFGDDWICGGNGRDELLGGDGNDILIGARGDDVLRGGYGADELTGGKGDDTFSFGAPVYSRYGEAWVPDIGVGEGARDVIQDFTQGHDVLDVSLLNSGQGSNPNGPFSYDEQFVFIGTQNFTPGGSPLPRVTPQLRYEIRDGQTIVQMDGSNLGGVPVDLGPLPDYRLPDGIVDAEFVLIGEFKLTADDFLL